MLKAGLINSLLFCSVRESIITCCDHVFDMKLASVYAFLRSYFVLGEKTKERVQFVRSLKVDK